ncbi:MAG: hypothetical protein PVF05_08080 [Gemmatimonadales bacterium]|jgi:hypothetical protein
MIRDRRAAWLGAAALLGAFALGAAAGAWWRDAAASRSTVESGETTPVAAAESVPGSGAVRIDSTVHRVGPDSVPIADSGWTTVETGPSVFDDLELSDAQQAAVDSILDEFSDWTDSALRREATRAQHGILEVLDPSQREKYLARIDSVGAIMRVRKIRVIPGGDEP